MARTFRLETVMDRFPLLGAGPPAHIMFFEYGRKLAQAAGEPKMCCGVVDEGRFHKRDPVKLCSESTSVSGRIHSTFDAGQ